MSESRSAAVKTPLVSIGLSVFNGEATLEEAIRSVQAQSQGDLELIICDGASGDRTAEICRDFAARDPRIRYHRCPRNLGHRAGHSLALACARGRYFKWLLHEDRLQPSYVACLQRVLDEREEVLLCNSIISRIDARGRSQGLLESALSRADSPSASQRLAFVVGDPLAGVDYYSGMGRTAALRELRVRQVPGAERARLALLSMRGRLAQVPQVLQEMREPVARSSFWQELHGKAWSRQMRNRRWPLHSEYLRIVRQAQLSRQEQLACLGVLAQAWAPACLRVRPALEALAALALRAPELAARSRAALAALVARRAPAERAARRTAARS